MRFFYKIFLSMMLILTVSLGAVEYLTVSYSLEHSVQREETSALSQHQMVKYSIQTVLLNVDWELDQQNLQDIGASAAETLGTENGMYFACEDVEYYNSCKLEPSTENTEAGQISYSIISGSQDEKYMQVYSCFDQDGRSFKLLTENDVSGLFTEAEDLRKRCVKFYWGILGAASVLLFLLSWTVTKPLHQLRNTTREFAAGKYGIRAGIRTRDEVGDLAKAFNYMAQTLENKIGELEDAARRLEDFTANFAHELKTPMTSIIGYADTLYQKDLPRSQVQQLAGIIMNEGMRLEALSFKLLELVTLQRNDFQLEEARIDQVVQDAVETALPGAVRRGVRIDCQMEEAWVRLEYDLFKTLLLNLLDNGVKSGTELLQVTGKIRGDSYYMVITDYGRGIPAEELQRITEAFYMVDKSRSRKEHGAGLGLALAAKIAELHGTKLVYESQPGCGTSVSMVLRREGDDEKNPLTV